jgi:hypothetical protein
MDGKFSIFVAARSPAILLRPKSSVISKKLLDKAKKNFETPSQGGFLGDFRFHPFLINKIKQQLFSLSPLFLIL